MNMSAAPTIPTLADLAATPGAKRGRYDEIISINGIPARQILNGFRPCLPERFVEFDRAGRGDALNVDLYGHCPAQNVAIVQVRHAFRRARKHRMNLHKDYVLCRFNELTHAPFRHPVSARAVHASIRKDGSDPAAPVCAAQRWMWQVTEKQLAVSVRQGDILLVPASRKPAGTTIPDQVHLVGAATRSGCSTSSSVAPAGCSRGRPPSGTPRASTPRSPPASSAGTRCGWRRKKTPGTGRSASATDVTSAGAEPIS